MTRTNENHCKVEAEVGRNSDMWGKKMQIREKKLKRRKYSFLKLFIGQDRNLGSEKKLYNRLSRSEIGNGKLRAPWHKACFDTKKGKTHHAWMTFGS